MKLTVRAKLPLERKLEILNSPLWPNAVDPELICDSDLDRMVRGVSIVRSFLPNLRGKSFFDPSFDPDVAAEADHCGAVRDDNYDVVLLYDYLDHFEGDPVELISSLVAKLRPGGSVHVRCHPWLSRHATHLYHSLNKAFAHLFLTPEELVSLGHVGTHTRTSTDCDRWLAESGLNVVHREEVKSPVEPIFSQLASRGLIPPTQLPHMAVSFIDYVAVP